MSKYTMGYSHNESDIPGQMEMDATTDAEAVQELRRFVEAGFRNGTSAGVELTGNRLYRAVNRHGEAVGAYVEW